MDQPDLKTISDSDLGNSRAREEAGRVVREIMRLGETFVRALKQKDQVRTRMQSQISEKTEEANVAFASLETIIKNLDVYDASLRKLQTALRQLQQKELLIKNKYQGLLQGTGAEEWNPEKVAETNPGISREDLIEKRRLFLDELDKTFTSLEDELKEIETARKDLVDAETQLKAKRDKAYGVRVKLEDQRSHLLSELKNLESALTASINEEKTLVAELEGMSEKLSAPIQVTEDIDKLLFSSLNDSAPQSANAPIKASPAGELTS